MAAFLTAEDEKMALARAAGPLTLGNAAADAESLNSLAPATARHRCCRGSAVRRTVHWVLASLFVVSCCLFAFSATSMVTGSRFHQKPCHDVSATNAAVVHPEVVHPDGHRSHQHSHEAAVAAAAEAAVAANTVPLGSAAGPLSPVIVDADNNGEAPASASSFSRLLEAVSPEALHDLLHAYLPDTYKHGVYPSEKSALAALHRANAPLATSIVQLARRDTNATVSAATSSVAPATSSVPAAASSSPVAVVSSTPASDAPTSSGPAATSSPTAAESTKAAATTATPTGKDTATTASAATTKAAETTAAATTSSGRKVTSTYTSTINGTPTVVTATSVVGVAATGSGSTATGTATAGASGTLQTGAAAPGSVGSMRMAGVAGLLAGAALLV